jgi:ribonuclease G
VVQVVKDPIGTKGARLTTQISIPSRYLVLLPQSKVVGVSARIEDEAERARLKGW